MGKNKNQKYTKEVIEEAVRNSRSLAGTLKKLGQNQNGSRNPWLKRLIAINNIDTSHFTGQGWNKGNVCYNEDEVFAENSKTARSIVRKFILRDKLIPYECAFCGNKGEWNGVPISLELDHINGVSNDHRLENLRFLCPNCHATTDTYCGRNIRKKNEAKNESVSCQKQKKQKLQTPKEECVCVDCGMPCSKPGHRCKACDVKSRMRLIGIPSLHEFVKEILDFGFLEVGRRYGVSSTAIRRYCDRYGIPRTRNELLKWYKDNAESELGPVSQKQPKNPRNKDLEPKMA